MCKTVSGELSGNGGAHARNQTTHIAYCQYVTWVSLYSLSRLHGARPIMLWDSAWNTRGGDRDCSVDRIVQTRNVLLGRAHRQKNTFFVENLTFKILNSPACSKLWRALSKNCGAHFLLDYCGLHFLWFRHAVLRIAARGTYGCSVRFLYLWRAVSTITVCASCNYCTHFMMRRAL